MMDTFQNKDFAINLKLFKRCRFYQIFDSSNTKVFGFNVYRLSFFLFVLLEHVPIIFGNSGFFFKSDNVLELIEFCQVVYGNIQYYLSIWEAGIILYNADRIWELFNVTRLNFFKSKHCRKSNTILYNHRIRSIRLTDSYYVFSIVIIIQWIIFPIIFNAYATPENDNKRILSVINFPYPITKLTYHNCYYTIYVIEAILASFLMYTLFMIDIVVLSFGWIIVAQYETLAEAFNNIGFEINNQSENNNIFIDDLKSVVIDHQQIDIYCKAYYLIMKPIILVYVVITSSLIIIMTYTLILILLSSESFSILGLIRVGSTDLYLCLQLYLYCFLLDTMNVKRESVNFGIFSCNLTRMDLKCKQLILLSMRMNDANQFVLNISPKKIINLQFFANVMMTCYNIVSVLVKTMKRKDGILE